MNKLICPRCGAENAADMAFCTSCGQSIVSAVLSHPSGAPASNFPRSSNPSQMPTASMPVAVTPAKNNRGWLYALLGCGGVLVVFLVGIIIAGVFFKLASAGQNNSNSSAVNANSHSISVDSNSSSSNSLTNDPKNTSTEQINSSALDEMRSLKQVGAFRQTEVKDVPAGDFYPSASEAVQVAYQNGKQNVAAIVARFPSNEASLADFAARLKGVKENGGKIYNNMNKNGVQGAAYKFKEYYYIEVCGEAICWRNYSSELNAVRVFAANFPNGSTKTKK